MNNNKTIIWTIVIVLILIAAGVWAYKASESSALPSASDRGMGNVNQEVPAPTSSTSTAANPAPQSPGPTNTPPGVKVFRVSGQNFSFSPSTITVNKGDTVKIIFANSGGTHDLKIDAFNVATPRIGTGQQASIEFVASKTGSFEYYCSVGDHRAMGMYGTLIVK